MGITVRCGNESFDIGYGGFQFVRTDIITKCLDSKGNQVVYYKDDEGNKYNTINDNLSKLIENKLFIYYQGEENKSLYDFICASDCKGRIRYSDSVKILKGLKNVSYLDKINTEEITYHSNTFAPCISFYNLLEKSVKERRNIYWE